MQDLAATAAFSMSCPQTLTEPGQTHTTLTLTSQSDDTGPSGAVSVTAIGTAFSVRREGEAVSIFITEGVVDVKTMHGGLTADVQGKAGQTVRLDHGQFVSLSSSALARGAGEWQPGELRFEDEPLRVVVASLNRYAPREIVLDDPELQELRFTGTVFNSGEEDWLHAAQRLFPIKIEVTENQVRITRRN